MVPTCKKRKIDFPTKQFISLPRHKTKGDIRDEWIKACKLDPSKILDESRNYVVCENHFESTDFERDLQSELLGLNRPKKLKANVVPWKDLPPENYQPDKPGENDEGHHQTDNVKTKDHAKTDKVKMLPKKKGRRKKRRRPPPPPRSPQFGCLICCKKIQGTAKSTDYFTKYVCPGARDHDNQEEDFTALNKQLWNIFIVRNVLKIESSKCAELLARFGNERDPEGWFHLCVKCGESVARALEIHQNILRLEEEIRVIFNGICETAKKTVEMDKDKDINLKKDEVQEKLWSLIREVNGIFPAAEVEIKDEPLDVDEDDSFNIPSSPVNCPIREKDNDDTSSNQSQMDLASRIDKILAQNQAIVGEPLCRPSWFDSDSGSDLDEHRPKLKKVTKAKLIKPKPPRPPPPKQPPKSPKRIRNRKQFLIPRKHLDNTYTKLNCSFNCPAVFSTKELLAQHVQAHKTSKQNGDKFECKFCGFVVLNEALLKQHLEVRHHGQTEPNIIDINFVDCPCPFCEIRFHNQNILKYEAHLKLHERNANSNEKLDCPHARCGYPAEDSNSLVRHLQNVHKEKLMHTCEICGYTVSKTLAGRWESHLVMHKLNEYITRDEGEKSTNKFGCPNCPTENFPTLQKLIRHKKVRHAEELGLDIFLCSDCPRTFFKKSHLHYHIKATHESTDDKTVIICETCGESCFTKFTLKLHQKKHSRPSRPVNERKPRKKYICERCGLEFSGLAKLRLHEAKISCGNEAKKGMECIHCKIMLPHRAAMRRHVKIHAQHKCNLCGNLFLSRDNMMKHKRAVHRAGPQTVIKCQHCGKEFKHRINLYSHLTDICKKIKGAVKSDVKCPNCDRAFRSKLALNGHMHSCKARLVEDKS